MYEVFFYVPKRRTYIRLSQCSLEMAKIGFFPNSYAAVCFDATSLEEHQTGTFEECYTD